MRCSCPHCAAALDVPPQLAGQVVRCHRCNGSLQSPVPEAAPASPPPVIRPQRRPRASRSGCWVFLGVLVLLLGGATLYVILNPLAWYRVKHWWTKTSEEITANEVTEEDVLRHRFFKRPPSRDDLQRALGRMTDKNATDYIMVSDEGEVWRTNLISRDPRNGRRHVLVLAGQSETKAQALRELLKTLESQLEKEAADRKFDKGG